MASPSNNVFLRLHKWAWRQNENFLTESLAVVLEHLLVLAPAVGARLVSRLTGGFIDLPPEDASAIDVLTQVEAGEGRPDLEIRSPHWLVWIEIRQSHRCELASWRATAFLSTGPRSSKGGWCCSHGTRRPSLSTRNAPTWNYDGSKSPSGSSVNSRRLRQ